MCGITLLINTISSGTDVLKHRGPDDHNEIHFQGHTMVFDRLSINDTSEKGRQPFCNGNTWFMCNGEIYNHQKLKEQYNISTVGKSDCEVVHHMLFQSKMQNLSECFRDLDGDFALIFVSKHHIVAARDPMGVRPLYIAKNEKREIIGFASEAKAFEKVFANIYEVVHFPPGHYWSNNNFISYQPISLYSPISTIETNRALAISMVRALLHESIFKRVRNTDRSVAFFLSGGLDSSIIASVAAKMFYPKKIETYSIGTSEKESPDLIAAKEVAKHIGSNHHVIQFNPETLFEKIEATVKAIESYDCTTVRASVPMYALSEYISTHTEHKVILSGEGADELFGGYLYFHNAPNDDEFHKETIRLCQDVHMYDVLRADRCTAAHGLELRVPFFDKAFVEYVISLHPSLKTPNSKTNKGLEKMILREAFHDYLPDNVLYRQKNGMSDAVGYNWVDYVRDHCPKKKARHFDVNQPMSSEELYYRELFEYMYGPVNLTSIKHVWRPRWSNESDPSARKLAQFKSE